MMASQWRSIDTAPKDGTDVLITDGETYAVASFKFGRWRDMGDIGWGGMDGIEPTHWQPLLPPREVEL